MAAHAAVSAARPARSAARVVATPARAVQEQPGRGWLQGGGVAPPWSFASIPLQSRLAVGATDDPLEREADAVADRVLRMPDPTGPVSAAPHGLWRKCAACEEEECGRMRMKAARSAEPRQRQAPPSVHHVLRSPGEQMDRATRGFLELRLGFDLGGVSIHRDAQAARSASEVDALAYTVGRHIVFGSGQYAPHTGAGRRLLAHELAHVAQQGAAPPMLQRTKVCSKRLEAPVVGWLFNHSYIDDTGMDNCRGKSMPGNYAVQTLHSGNFADGCALKTATSDDPQDYTPNMKDCTPAPGVTNLSRCLRDAYDAYADPSIYRNLPVENGPNSNTFAATLAKACCADGSSRGLGWVPGWDHAPATPCNPKGPAPVPGLFPPERPPPGIAEATQTPGGSGEGALET